MFAIIVLVIDFKYYNSFYHDNFSDTSEEDQLAFNVYDEIHIRIVMCYSKKRYYVLLNHILQM